MTVCSNCGNTQGPFNKRYIPGKALCGVNPQSEDYMKIVKACNQRRAKIDRGNEAGA